MSDVDAEIAAVRSEMSTSRGDQAPLNAKLEALYREKYRDPGAPAPTPRPDGYQPTTEALAEANIRTERLGQLQAEREQPLNTTARNAALDTEIEDVLRADYEAEKSHAPEAGPTPTTVEWPAGTEEPVQNALCALCLEHNITASEAQVAIRALTNVPPMPADPVQGRAVLTREFGGALPHVLSHAEQMFEELPPRLQRLIQEPEVFFSPPVLRHLNLIWERSRRGGR
ncbi:MAG TPA: hypothetical protein VGK42_10130 [Candidatus Dormibacteraeota bacterium]|jgi:hypothetical protein